MKVLHFIWSGNFGGIEKTAIDLAMEQNRLQIAESHILIGCRKGEFLDLLANLKIPHHIGELHSGTDFNPIKIIKICNLIKSFDIIHFHTFNAVVMIASILSGRKIFYTIHGNLNYGKKIRLGDKINNFLRSWFFNRYVDFISFNSNWTKEQSLAKFKITHSRSAVIYNGINLDPVEDIGDTADHDITGQLKNKFVVGTASRFNAGKRIDRLIRAFAIFAGNNQNSLLLLVGDGEQKSALKKLVNELNIQHKVIFTGYQPNSISWQKLFDLAVYPFQDEAFGLSVLEGLSLGKPAIIFKDSGGTVELFGSEFSDDIVDSIEGLATRIEYYYQNRSNTRVYNASLRIKASHRFPLEKMALTFQKYYRSLP